MANTLHTPKVLLVTGGAGFIGSHVVRRWVTRHPDVRVINLDALTYAGNLANLQDIEGAPNHRFVKMDIRDTDGVTALMKEENVDSVMHLAAESHVDRSISGPMAFLETNIYLLVLTFVVSIVHSVFEFLAFKNDIQFWNKK